jgi:hypothetical protein
LIITINGDKIVNNDGLFRIISVILHSNLNNDIKRKIFIKGNK